MERGDKANFIVMTPTDFICMYVCVCACVCVHLSVYPALRAYISVCGYYGSKFDETWLKCRPIGSTVTAFCLHFDWFEFEFSCNWEGGSTLHVLPLSHPQPHPLTIPNIIAFLSAKVSKVK